MKKIFVTFLTVLVLVHLSFYNAVAIGATKAAPVNITTAVMAQSEAAFPAAVLVGVVVVSAAAAFAYGVYAGYQEAARAAGSSEVLAQLTLADPYESMDFSKFDN